MRISVVIWTCALKIGVVCEICLGLMFQVCGKTTRLKFHSKLNHNAGKRECLSMTFGVVVLFTCACCNVIFYPSIFSFISNSVTLRFVIHFVTSFCKKHISN